MFDRPERRPAAEVFRDYAAKDPEAARILLDYESRTRERLNVLASNAPEPIVIHGDFAPWNMRYRAGRLSALFDFDLAHLDLRVADFALSWRGKHDDILVGYESEAPLQEIEHELLVPIYWAWMLAGAVLDIEEGNGSPEWALTHLLRQPTDRWPLEKNGI